MTLLFPAGHLHALYRLAHFSHINEIKSLISVFIYWFTVVTKRPVALGRNVSLNLSVKQFNQS